MRYRGDEVVLGSEGIDQRGHLVEGDNSSRVGPVQGPDGAAADGIGPLPGSFAGPVQLIGERLTAGCPHCRETVRRHRSGPVAIKKLGRSCGWRQAGQRRIGPHRPVGQHILTLCVHHPDAHING